MASIDLPAIPDPEMALRSELEAKINGKTKPVGSLGRLESLALQIGLLQGELSPTLKEPHLAVFVGDHGISAEGVSAYPQSVTGQMLLNFLQGGAAINVLARLNHLQLLVVNAGLATAPPGLAETARRSQFSFLDMVVRRGTRNCLYEDALTPQELQLAFQYGRQIIDKLASRGCNAIGFGEMGIGNTSAASLLHASLTGSALRECVGSGSGLDRSGLERKYAILSQALERFGRQERLSSPRLGPQGLSEELLEGSGEVSGERSAVSCGDGAVAGADTADGLLSLKALAAYGGCEIAMMTAAMLYAAERRMLIVVDGYIATVAFLAAFSLRQQILPWAIFAHLSEERGHSLLLSFLKAKPLLHLNLRLGEATGAALAFGIVRAAISLLNEMASFEEAGVSQRCRY